MQVCELSEGDDNPDDFRAAQVSIGMLGVLTEVTLRVREEFRLEENRTHHTLDYCLKNMKDLVEDSRYKYLKIWIEFYNNFCILYQTGETVKPIADNPSELQSFLTVRRRRNKYRLVYKYAIS